MDELDSLLDAFGDGSNASGTPSSSNAASNLSDGPSADATSASKKSMMDRMKEKRLSRRVVPGNNPNAIGGNSGLRLASGGAASTTDDLDSFLLGLGDEPAPSPAAASPAAAAAAFSEPDSLDNLIASLSSPTASPAASPAASRGVKAERPAGRAAPPSNYMAQSPLAAHSGADDIDSLISGLTLGAPAMPAPAKPAPAKPAPVDDIDSLIMGLTGPTAATPVRPAPAAAPPADDIDSLIMGLTATTTAPAAAPVAAAPSDIDSLIMGLTGGAPASSAPVRPAAAPAPAAPVGNSAVADIDALLGSLNAPGNVRPVSAGVAPLATAPAPAGGAVRPVSTYDQIGDLMKTFGPGSTLGVSTAAAAGAAGGPSKGTCAACRRPIMQDATQAGGQMYHRTCWTCGGCGLPLGANSFFMIENVPHCERCYQAIFCARCGHCDRPITGQCIEAVGKKYHVPCFVCTQCQTPLGSQMFFERDGQPFCETCYSSIFSYRCATCGQVIQGDAINALGKQYHPHCFVCSTCRRAFNNQPFFEVNGMPYCETHFHQQRGAVCASCQRPVVGRMVEVAGRVFHPEHFLCAFCMNSLAGQSFSEKDNKFYCTPCTKQLFG